MGLKTRKTTRSVAEFVAAIEDEHMRADCAAVIDIMTDVTGAQPAMWGSSIIGFGSYHYVYESGREGDWPVIGLSPRKRNLTLYIMPGFSAYNDLLGRLGKYKTGKSCLYLNRLSDVDVDVLRQLIELSVESMREKYPVSST